MVEIAALLLPARRSCAAGWQRLLPHTTTARRDGPEEIGDRPLRSKYRGRSGCKKIPARDKPKRAVLLRNEGEKTSCLRCWPLRAKSHDVGAKTDGAEVA